MAGVKFDITGNANGYLSAVRQAENATKNLTRNVENDGNALDTMFKKLATSAAAFFTIQQASQLVKQITSVRGEFQQLEVAFTTMLRSKEKADKLMMDAAEFAATTPFDLKGVAAGIRQNLAYGASAETVIDEMRMLGDVAAGLSMPLNDLVYLYGTLRTSGRVATIDIRQFAGRGIPIYEELAKVLGVAKNEVAGLVTEGKVGFADVEQAFKNMTSSGGMFYNLMADQSKTINGQISNLKDNIEMMFNEIGKSQEGVINKALSVVGSLVENYEKIGRVLAVLVTTYGTYKAAVIAVIAAQKAQSVILRQAVLEKALAAKEAIVLSNAEAVAAAKTALLQSAQQKLLNTLKALNKTMLANPYVLAATAIAGVTVGLVNMAKAADSGQAGVDKYNKALAKNREEIEKHNKALDDAFNTARNEQLSIDARVDALNALRESYSEIFAQYATEEEILQNLLSIRQQINEEDKKRNFNAKNAKLESLDAQIAKLTSDKDVAAKTGGGQAVMAIQNQIDALKKERELVAKEVGELAKGLSPMGPEEPVFYLDREKTTLKQVDELYKAQKQLLDEMKEEGKADKDAIARKQKLVDSIENEMLAREGELNTVSKVKERIKELQEEQEGLVINSKEYIAVQQRINKLQAKIPKSTADNKDAKEDIKKAQEYETKVKSAEAQKAVREQEDLDNQVEQARINAMADGAEKRRAQRALDNAMELQQIKRAKEDFVEAYIERERAIFEAEENTRAAQDPTYQKKAFDDEEARARAEASDEAKQYSANLVYTKRKQEAESREEEAELIRQINDELLGEFKTYEQQRSDITDKYSKAREKLYKKDALGMTLKDENGKPILKEGVTQGNIEEINRAEQEDLAAIDQQFAAREAQFQAWMNEVANLTLNQLNAVLAEAEKELAALEAQNPNDQGLAMARAKVGTLRKTISHKNAEKDVAPGKRSIDEWEDLQDVLSDCVSAFDEIGEAVGGVAGEVISTAGNIASSTLTMINGIVQLVNMSTTGMTATAVTASTAISTVEKASVILAVISAALQIVMAIINAVKGLADKDNEKAIERLTNANEDLDKSYEKLERSIDKAYSVDASKLIEQQNTLLEQKKANLRLMIAEEKAKKNANEEQIKEWENEINGIETSIEDNAEKAKEAVNGISFDGFRDNFLDALLDMEEGAEGLADTIEEDIRKAMYDALLSDDAFEQQMRSLYDDLAAAIEAGDTREIDRIKAAILNLYDSQEQKAREIDEKLGYEADSTREASEKGVAQASQSSVDEMNGRMTAVQSHTFSINERVGSLLNVASQMLARVISIEGYTARLAEIDQTLYYMRSDISDILTKGIKIKA